jgi:hypothetical protein
VKGGKLSKENRKEAIKLAVDLIEKETVYFTGKRRNLARKKYQALLRLCGKNCQIDEPIYLKRSE